MKASSDPEFARFKNADFAAAKPVAKTPHLRKLQAQLQNALLVKAQADAVAVAPVLYGKTSG